MRNLHCVGMLGRFDPLEKNKAALIYRSTEQEG